MPKPKRKDLKTLNLEEDYEELFEVQEIEKEKTELQMPRLN